MEFVKKGGKVWGRGWLSERRVGEVRSVEGDEDGAGPKWNKAETA